MTRHSYFMRTVAKLATVVLLLGLLVSNASANKVATKSMTTPDFAYPKTVEKNAATELEKAVAHGDWPAALKATIQNVTASNLISTGNVVNGLAKIDSIAALAPAEWEPAFRLVEVDIYNALYGSQRWKADNRKLPLDSVPANPYEWSRDIFADKVLNLCNEIIDGIGSSGKPLSEWKSFLENTSDSFAFGMTVDEFLCKKCFSYLNMYSDEARDVIPFFAADNVATTPVQKCMALRNKAIDLLIDMAEERNQPMLLAEALSDKGETLPESLRMKFLVNAYDIVKGTEGEQIILSDFRQYCNASQAAYMESAFPFSLKEYIDMLQKSIADFPKGRYVNSIKNILNDFTQPFANIRYTNQYLTSSTITMDVTLSNCNVTWLLIYDFSPYENATRQPKTKDLAARCRLVKAVKVTADGSIPFEANAKAEIGSLPAGIYAVVPSATPDSKGIYATIQNNSWREPFKVSDISVKTLRYPNASTQVFVVDGANGKPIEGATVKIFTRKNYSSPRVLARTLTTGPDGSVIVTDDRFEIEASYNGSKWSGNRSSYSTFNKDTTRHDRIQILADRGIYHPGDSLKGAVIAYFTRQYDMQLNAERKFEILLRDPNGKEVANQLIETDRFGRAAVDFELPEQGLLGSWQLMARDEEGKNLGSTSFQVADYVAPTFFITSENTVEDINPGDVVRIKGQVLTYSGMPVANATVRYSIRYNPPMRWFSTGWATYDSSVTAGEDGKYTIELPTANLIGTQFERGVFYVQLSATSPAGETQEGPTERFAIGREFNIYPAGGSPLTINASESMPDFLFYVTDMLGRKVKKEVNYTMVNSVTNEVVAEGSFMSPTLSLPSKDYPSATYWINVNMAEDEDVEDSLAITIWKNSDKSAPEGTKLWVPIDKVTAKEGAGEVNVTVGSGIADRWIPAVLSSDDDEILSVEWLHVDKDNLSVPVKAPLGNMRYNLNLSYLSDLETDGANVVIYSASSENNLRVATESFRDKISSGEEEHWSFRFYKKSGNAADIPAIAVMTDAALNAIAPFKWNFSPQSNRRGSFYLIREDYNHPRYMKEYLKSRKYLSFSKISFPMINDYGQRWGLFGRMNGAVVYDHAIKNEVFATVETTSLSIDSRATGMMRKAAAAAPKEEEAEYALEDAVAISEDSDGEIVMAYGVSEGNAGNSESNELRESEFPVAFFMPYLTADSAGVVNIDFTVPNFNTTWAFQLLGYDETLQTAKIDLQAVASKPIMVSTHAPRFVRTGDVIELAATVFNNSDSACAPQCRFELVDLLSGKIISAKEFAAEEIKVAGSRLLSMTWNVPSDASSVGFRAYAAVEGHRDGEQTLIPVLPASSPVVESTPFWLAPATGKLEVKLPKFKDSDQITLQYCDNPAWYCLTALPDIVTPESKSVTSKIRALFGNAMAHHLIASDPNLKRGLEVLLSDKDSEFAALKSNLEKDGNLKITQLSNTPWVNSAESETLRMSRLSSLLDESEASKSISEIYGDIRDLQDKDGGWSWCPGMESSPYITRDVLRHFAMIYKAGAIGSLNDSEGVIRKGIRYVDSETVKDYKKYHKKGESASYLLDWLYVRSSFPASFLPSGSVGNEMASIATKALKDIAAEWKEMSIGQKAKAATLLWRSGNHKTASQILESLRQYASESPEKGVWFDNLYSGWGRLSTLQTTTLVLRAYSEIQPENGIIDSLRQWLVLGRMYQDWGKNTSTVETVDAILSSGTNWTDSSNESETEFKLNGKPLEVPTQAKLTGAFTLTLNAKEASKKTLAVSRNGSGPAWGGVISQYESPILDVKPSEVPELSIRKSIVALEEGDNGQLIPKEGIILKKGMKVRVTLFINAGRDMDYVAVTDERSACLEPVEQLSGYTASDRVGYYKEVRDEVTNLFFGWLPKGDHVISYDCRVSQDGEFSCGIATAQSQYSPTVVAHSAGSILKVE